MVQKNDYVVDGAMTDPKGDRGLAPSAQKDPDLFVHIVERREDGIVVRGAKAHQTGTINSHWHIVMPTPVSYTHLVRYRRGTAGSVYCGVEI